MKRCNINVAIHSGPTQIAAYVSDAFPGIAVHKDVGSDDFWTATHINSGLALSTTFRLRRLATSFATLASRQVDFSKSVEEVEKQVADRPGVGAKLRELAGRFKR